MDERISRKSGAIDLIIIFIFLNSLGFPGNYVRVFGGWLDTVIEYTAFLLMMVVMIMTSADNLMEMVVLDLRKRYAVIYVLVGVLFCTSMMVTISPGKQIITCVRMSVTVLFVLWLCNQFSLQEILEKVYFAQILFLGLTIVFVVVFSGYVHRESAAYADDFVGLYSAKNGAGSELAFGILVQVVLLRMYSLQHKPIPREFVIVLAVQAVLLFLTHNVGAMLCLSVPVIYLLRVEPRAGMQWRLPLGWLYIVGSVGFLIVALTILPLFAPLLEALGKDATLTGRIPLWEACLDLISEHNTLMGYGYAMFWRNEKAVALLHSAFDENSFMAHQMSGSHNVLTEMLLNSGVLGVGTFFIAMLEVMRRIREMDEEHYLWCSAYVIFFMMYGFTERAFTTYEYLTMFLFLTMGIACIRPERGPLLRRSDLL